MKLIKNIALFSLVTLVVILASGINIFIHHCSCIGENQISVFVEEDCTECIENDDQQNTCCLCQDNHESEIARQKQDPKNDWSFIPRKSSQKKGSFCNTRQQFIQIEDDFIPILPETIPSPLQLTILLFTNFFSNIDLEDIPPSPQYASSPPNGLQKESLEFIFLYRCLKIPTYSC